MISWRWLVRGIACASVVWFMAWVVGSLMAETKQAAPQQPRARTQTVNQPQPIAHPYSSAVRGCFGYYSTTWRRWPGERRQERENPRSLGTEVLPTPPGREEIPPPKATMPKKPMPQAEQPEPQPQPQQPATPSLELQPPEAGKIVPPEGLLAPSQFSEEPFGAPEKKEPTKPVPESELPSLPGLPPDLPSPPPEQDKKPPEKAEKQSPPKESGKKETTSAARDLWRDSAVSLASGVEPRREDAKAGVHHADAIGVASPAKEEPFIKEPAAYATAGSPPKATVVLPEVAIDGYCAVELADGGRWVRGDVRYTVVRDGWIYRFSGADQRQRFLTNPEKYVPTCSGNDPVVRMEQSRDVRGQLAYCALYNGHLYIFSSAATRDRFNANPQRYAVR